MSETKTAKRLTGGIIAIIILAVCLCITTFALVYASVSVENNRQARHSGTRISV